MTDSIRRSYDSQNHENGYWINTAAGEKTYWVAGGTSSTENLEIGRKHRKEHHSHRGGDVLGSVHSRLVSHPSLPSLRHDSRSLDADGYSVPPSGNQKRLNSEPMLRTSRSLAALHGPSKLRNTLKSQNKLEPERLSLDLKRTSRNQSVDREQPKLTKTDTRAAFDKLDQVLDSIIDVAFDRSEPPQYVVRWPEHLNPSPSPPPSVENSSEQSPGDPDDELMCLLAKSGYYDDEKSPLRSTSRLERIIQERAVSPPPRLTLSSSTRSSEQSMLSSPTDMSPLNACPANSSSKASSERQPLGLKVTYAFRTVTEIAKHSTSKLKTSIFR
ncbi:uncharacterized protein V1516DRAFT_677574 [Lipomyces oligophaga]|uniref:uncharacterized protein n=1 Tax=Lipomyces oligophaga TaxID=45792 RepID=UPI0034CF184A